MTDLDDAWLERRIKAELAACHTAREQGRSIQAQKHWQEFVKLISSRSPRQIAKMEKRAGLADA